MKKLFSIMTALLVIGFWANTSAQVKISGDLQVRPRYDMKDYGAYGGTKDDMYYMMRARLNFSANIGDGWYGKIQLAHYNYAGYFFTNGLGEGPGLHGEFLYRPAVNFTQMYFGYKGKTVGIAGGIIPLNGIANPMLDVHYLPYNMVDIPFAIYRLNSAIGFKGYVKLGPGQLNVSATLDENGFSATNSSGTTTTDTHDCYTLGFDYTVKVAGFKLQPAFYYSLANDSTAAPMTYGINIATPKFAGFGFGVTAAMTSNNVDGSAKYDGTFFRFKVTGKVGPGAVTLWYDMAKRTDKYSTGDIDENYGYVWAAYTYHLTKKVLVMPRVRILTDKIDNTKDYRRTKAEVLFIAKF